MKVKGMKERQRRKIERISPQPGVCVQTNICESQA